MSATTSKQTIKAITIWQPYASLILSGYKQFETRSWPTKFRGPLIIHAAKRWDEDRAGDLLRIQELIEKSDPIGMLEEQERLARLPIGETIGCALGVVDLASCEQMDDGGSEFENEVGCFGPGRYGWECQAPLIFPEPIPAVGKQGLWTPDTDLEIETRHLLEWQ